MKFRLIYAEKAENNIAVYIIDYEQMNKKEKNKEKQALNQI